MEYARAYSPLYQELYRDLPSPVRDVRTLPVTDKSTLMGRFDEWVTDRRINLADVTAHVDDPERAGEPLFGAYTAVTTSGTSGKRGIFLLENDSIGVVVALGLRASAGMMSPKVIGRMLRRLGRSALLVPTGGHFGTYVGAVQQTKGSKTKARITEIIPVTAPLDEIVARLNAQRPGYLESYPTVVSMLAGEQEAGRLRIRPGVVRLTGEGVGEDDRQRIAEAFDARVLAFYGANEMPALMACCAYGWYHSHDDWTILEPVDADHRPTPPGQWSDTVLISVLYRRAQPILRYDLGDAILQRPEPCPCGSPFTAIRVGGRASDTLHFPKPNRGEVALSPLVLETQLERTAGLEVFQLEQTAPDILRLRLQPGPGADPDQVWQVARGHLAELLADHGLGQVTIECATETPKQTIGGKYRSVIPFT